MKTKYAIVSNTNNRVNSIVDMLLRSIIRPTTITVTPIIPRTIMNVAIISSMYVTPTDFSILMIFEKLNPSLIDPDSTMQILAICEM